MNVRLLSQQSTSTELAAPSTRPPMPLPEDRAALTRWVTLLSAGTAAGLIALKAGAWWVSGSVAVLASLADSALDLLASLVTVFAVRYAAAPPDAEHRYGHGKAEAFASLTQAGLVFASAALVGREAIARLFDPQPMQQETAAIVVMVASIVATGVLVAVQTRVLARTRSIAVEGDRMHYLSDLAGNGVVLVGVLGAALLDLPALDAVAGLLVALWLAWSAQGVLRASADQLMDHELPAAERAEIMAAAADDPRVIGVHELRTRTSGPVLHMQMHMDLDPELTLAQAHEIVHAAEERLAARWPGADVIIHPDPEGRAESHAVLAEPSR